MALESPSVIYQSDFHDLTNALLAALDPSRLKPRQDVVYSTSGFTRPNTTTQYAIGDAIADSATAASAHPLVFPGVCVPGGNGVILNATLHHSTNEATLLTADLWLFDRQPANPADNVAWAPSDESTQRVVAIVPFATGYTGLDATGGNTVYPVTNINAGYSMDSGSTLYGILVATNTYTPIALEVLTVRLVVMPAA
jgi:hypothetical protein